MPGIGKPERLPNPILAYDDLLDRYVDGTLSKIHGDLHLGNILVGPNASAFLIDFAMTRNGHTLFDWASLEVSLLTGVVMPVVGDDWYSVRLVLRYIASLQKDLPDSVPALNEVMQHVRAVREIARECLARDDSWSEYYIALTMCALRGYCWDTLSLGSRRLMFLLAALSIHELRNRGTLIMDDGPNHRFPRRPHGTPVIVTTGGGHDMSCPRVNHARASSCASRISRIDSIDGSASNTRFGYFAMMPSSRSS
ncbi:MAG: phosphotransferase [Anaerolineae bacterium]